MKLSSIFKIALVVGIISTSAKAALYPDQGDDIKGDEIKICLDEDDPCNTRNGCCDALWCLGPHGSKTCKEPPVCLEKDFDCSVGKCCNGLACVVSKETGLPECQVPAIGSKLFRKNQELVNAGAGPVKNTHTTRRINENVVRNIACSTGDPHVYTFDGLKYDCHGEGEFILAKSFHTAREVQVRYEHMSAERALSVGKAVAIRDEGDMPIVQINIASLQSSLGEDMNDEDGCGPVQFFVDGVQRDLNNGSGQDDKVIVTRKDNDIWVEYVESGMMVKVRYHRCRLNVCLHLPDTDQTVGVLGTATNNIHDDWTLLDGTVLDMPLSLADRLQKPAYDYCTQNFCIRDADESLFTYSEVGFDFDYYQKCDLPYASTIEQNLADVPQWVIQVCEGEFQCIVDVQNGNDQDAIAMRDTLAEYATMCNPPGGECDDSPCCSGECVDQGGFAGKVCDGETTCAPQFGNCGVVDCCDGLTCTERNDGIVMCMEQRESADEWMSCEEIKCADGLVCLDNQKGGKQCRRLHQCSEKWDDCSMVSCCGIGEMKCLSNGFGGKHCVEVADCYNKEGMDCSDITCCDGLTCVQDLEEHSVCKKLPDFVGLGESCMWVPCREDKELLLACVDVVDEIGRQDKQCRATPGDAKIFVFDDTNANGIQDFGEPGLAGVKLQLIRDKDNITLVDQGALTTDQDGYAAFSGVPRGIPLRVKVLEPPRGAVRTRNNQGADEMLDSDLVDNGISNPFVFKGEDTWTKTALGYRMPADLEILVFNDKNGNGIQDSDEVGIPDVGLRLITVDSVGIFDLGNGGNAHLVLATDKFGKVTFTKVPQDVELRVFVTKPPPGAIPTESRQGGDDTNDSDLRSDGTSYSFALKTGTAHTSLDLGFRMPETLRVRVWDDANFNGIRDDGEVGIAGVRIRLADDKKEKADLPDYGGNANEELVTDIKGLATFTKLAIDQKIRVQVIEPPKGALNTFKTKVDGDEIGSDLESDGFTNSFTIQKSGSEVDLGYRMPGSMIVRVFDDANGNGLQDEGETGIPGVNLRLIKDEDKQDLPDQGNGGNAHLVVASDLDGFVSFSKVPRGIFLRVKVTNFPKGATRTIQNADKSLGDSEIDSDLGADGLSDRFHLTEISTQNIDLGFRMPSDVKIRVFDDKNNNGMQDFGELGIKGVKLRLVNERDNSFYLGECEAVNNDEKIGQGNCNEEVVSDEDGYVVFSKVPKAATFRVKVINKPEGLKRSIQNHGGNKQLDSDLGDDGMTDPFSLSNFVGTLFEEIDLGYVCPESIEVRVWADMNGNGVQDPGELGIEGVGLRLIRAKDESFVSEELRTDIYGLARFEKAPTGEELRVKVMNAPAGAVPTQSNMGADEATDSDLRSDGTSFSFDLRSFEGSTYNKIDFGYLMPSDMRVRVWDDLNGNGIQDPGELGIQGVKLRLVNDETNDFVCNIGGGSNAHEELISDEYGIVTFLKVPRDFAFRVKVTNAPAGAIRTAQNQGGNGEFDSDLGDDLTSDIVKLNSFVGPGAYGSLDLGFRMPKRMVVRVWNDKNRNGIQDDDEVGIPGVKMRIITDTGRENLPEQGNGGNAHEEIATDALGWATFNKVPQGIRMRIKMTKPPIDGTVTKKKATSDNHLDSEMNVSGVSDSFKLPNDATELFDTVDVGYYFPTSLKSGCVEP